MVDYEEATARTMSLDLFSLKYVTGHNVVLRCPMWCHKGSMSSFLAKLVLPYLFQKICMTKGWCALSLWSNILMHATNISQIKSFAPKGPLSLLKCALSSTGSGKVADFLV